MLESRVMGRMQNPNRSVLFQYKSLFFASFQDERQHVLGKLAFFTR